MELVLELDEDTQTALSRRAQSNGFESTEEYARTVLETVMDELETDTTNNEVEDRLEDLGYLS